MTKKQKLKEDRATDVIIACILRGFTDEDWREVFRRVDERSKSASITEKSRAITRQELNEPFTI